jgi:hypothetical protein
MVESSTWQTNERAPRFLGCSPPRSYTERRFSAPRHGSTAQPAVCSHLRHSPSDRPGTENAATAKADARLPGRGTNHSSRRHDNFRAGRAVPCWPYAAAAGNGGCALALANVLKRQGAFGTLASAPSCRGIAAASGGNASQWEGRAALGEPWRALLAGALLVLRSPPPIFRHYFHRHRARLGPRHQGRYMAPFLSPCGRRDGRQDASRGWYRRSAHDANDGRCR